MEKWPHGIDLLIVNDFIFTHERKSSDEQLRKITNEDAKRKHRINPSSLSIMRLFILLVRSTLLLFSHYMMMMYSCCCCFYTVYIVAAVIIIIIMNKWEMNLFMHNVNSLRSCSTYPEFASSSSSPVGHLYSTFYITSHTNLTLSCTL